MNFKRWNIAFLGLMAAVLVFVAGMNYFVDPFCYFRFQSGDYEDIVSIDSKFYLRELKAQHVKNFGDQYDTFVLGGSKTGSYRNEKLEELDGYKTYNLFGLHGSFYEYELLTDFIFQYASPKRIILNISGSEVNGYQWDQTKFNNTIPAAVTGESKLLETVDFLFKDVKNSFERLDTRRGTEGNYQGRTGGERNLDNYYKRMEDEEEWTAYTKKSVLGSFKSHTKSLITRNRKSKDYEACLQALERIKSVCDQHGTELMVIILPSFFTEYEGYDSTYYREFLGEMAWITDYWDFSGYHDISMNPYNFYDEMHFYYEVGDLIVDTINGTDSYPDFGYHVTKENAAEYVKKRQADFDELKQEYEETGTVQIQGLEDESCLIRR